MSGMKEIVPREIDLALSLPARQKADENPVLVYLGSLAPGSRPTMAQSLDTVAALVSDGKLKAVSFPWWNIRYQHMERIQSALREKELAPATINKMMTAVKQVLLRCRKLGLMSSEHYDAARDIKPLKAWGKVKGRMIERDEIVRMLAMCDASVPIDVRDKAVLILLATSGMRRDEAANVQLDEFDQKRMQITIARGKGGKPRVVPVHGDLATALAAWLEVRGLEPGALFCVVLKGGQVRPTRQVSTETIYALVNKVATRAALDERISPHDFRRTFISMLLDAGGDIKAVSTTVGHSEIETTARYDRRGERAMRKVVDLLPTFSTKEEK